MKKYLICLTVLTISISSCVSAPEVVYEREVTEDHGSREWGALEVKLVVEKMVESLYVFLKEDWNGPAYLQVKKFRNRTAEHIDTGVVTDEMTTELIKRRIKFLDESLAEDSIKEMEKGMTGLYDQSTAVPTGFLKSPNFYLSGDIREAVSTRDGREIQLLVVTMRLYNIKTGEIHWQENARFLKSKSKDKGKEF
ncbi:MAG: hypothetical protein JXK07_02500 [Spirochaetes bacterium]|nr:hypothetical protein [Spirochaetota bacterium]MBN2771923.1 hypothetical protein [Spirochaetota bacterium]HRX14702.1 hypothetical protein [Spirochaetota bacterium]